MNTTVFINAFSIAALVAVLLVAQDNSVSNEGVASIAFLQDVSELSNKDLSDTLLELKERTKQLKLEIENSASSSVQNNPTIGSSSKEIRASVNSNDANKLKEMEKTFEVLQKIISEKRRRQIEVERTSMEDDLAAPGSSSRIKLPNVNSDGTIVPMGSDTKSADQETMQSSQSDTNAIAVPKQVVSKIIDPFELGNSLFLQGNFEEAQNFYKLVPENQLSSFDQVWLLLMKASCHRATGDVENAEAIYREVANTKLSSRQSTIAKGWLEYLTTKKAIDGLYNDYEKKADVAINKADKLIEELNAYKN